MRELPKKTSICLALGYFDSVHLGHRKIIEYAKNFASECGAYSAAATFINNAYKLFNPTEKCVYTYLERCGLLDGLCDYVLPMRFDARFKDTDAQTFLDALFATYDIKGVVCGYDYLFGAGAKGDCNTLKEYCDGRKVPCKIFDKVEVDGERVSTTAIKFLLKNGDIEGANKFLGAPFMIRGKVVPGRGAGRMINMPTANLKISNDKFLPKNGVYGVKCVIDGNEYFGATNIGSRPTYGLTKTVVETMLNNFNDNIYDKDITLYFYKYLRDVKKFDTPAELSRQVQKDIRWYEI